MFIRRKIYEHRNKAAWQVYRELMRVEAELEAVKRERDLHRVMAEGYRSMAQGQEKETYRYKSLYEREARKNSKCKMQNAKLWSRLLEAISASESVKEGGSE